MFVSFVGAELTGPQRVDSVEFFDGNNKILHEWSKDAPLQSLGTVGRPPQSIGLKFVANEQAVEWSKDNSPMSATAVIDGVQARGCQLQELDVSLTENDEPLEAPVQLTNINLAYGINYGNCRHCLQSFLCGCLKEYDVDLSETVGYCTEDSVSLANCDEVKNLLFDIP